MSKPTYTLDGQRAPGIQKLHETEFKPMLGFDPHPATTKSQAEAMHALPPKATKPPPLLASQLPIPPRGEGGYPLPDPKRTPHPKIPN